jgi:hypothetical protein
VSTRPRPEEYPTAWSYWTARRVWLRSHGGSIIPSLGFAVFFGALAGFWWMVALIVFALVCHAAARSE